jgi:hypothetical protein
MGSIEWRGLGDEDQKWKIASLVAKKSIVQRFRQIKLQKSLAYNFSPFLRCPQIPSVDKK